VIRILFYLTKCSRPGEGRLVATPGQLLHNATTREQELFSEHPAFWITYAGDGPLCYDPQDIGPDTRRKRILPPLPKGKKSLIIPWDSSSWRVLILAQIDYESVHTAISDFAAEHFGKDTTVVFENLDTEIVSDYSVLLH
jgi:hypothetical protein